MKKPLKILIKFPTRSRPHQFLKVLNLLVDKSADKENISYLISYDSDDSTMSEPIIEKAKQAASEITICGGTSNNKVHACNRDIEIVKEWDIVVLISDDMIPQIEGWDNILRQAMTKYYPDTDGCLWFFDGYQDRICTLVIMGKKYFDRTGYLYHPDYNSLFCDNEQTLVAQKLNKMTYIPLCIFKHEHFANNASVKRDNLYNKNEGFYRIDEQVFLKREANNFDL